MSDGIILSLCRWADEEEGRDWSIHYAPNGIDIAVSDGELTKSFHVSLDFIRKSAIPVDEYLIGYVRELFVP